MNAGAAASGTGAGPADREGRRDRHMRQIVESSLQGIVIHRGGPPLYVNDALARMVGLEDAAELMAEPSIAPFIHPDDRDMVLANVAERQRGQAAPLDYEFRLISRDDRVVWVDCRASRVEWDGGPAVLAMLFDISDRKRAEEDRRRSDALFAKVFQVTPDVITLTTLKDGRYVDVNENFLTWLGYERDEVIGRTADELDVWAEPGFRDVLLDRIRSEGGVRDLQTRVRRRDGSSFDVSVSGATLHFEDQGMLLLVTRDVTERMHHMRELHDSKKAAEAANRAKSEFLANVSHELRTPLNAIIGFSEMLRDQMLGPIGTSKYVEYAGDIHNSGSHLLDIINDILDLSKLESGKVELRKTAFPVRDVVASCIGLIRERAYQDGLELEIDLRGPLTLVADKRYVKQMLLNLLSNAMKFTPKHGKIVVRAARTDAGGCRIEVSDTGIGMTADDIETALKPFGQVDSPYTRKHSGSGLGVPLVKTLVERHGGSMEIESAPGQGTTVSLIFPPDDIVGHPA